MLSFVLKSFGLNSSEPKNKMLANVESDSSKLLSSTKEYVLPSN